jgi:hypothetical protein
MLDFLNTNSGALSVIFSAVVTLATVVYAILTWRLVEETSRMRKVQTEPRVSISTVSRKESASWVDIKFENIGLGPAYNVNFEIVEDTNDAAEEWLSHRGFFRDGINYLAPGDKIQFFLTTLSEDHSQKMETSFTLKAEFEGATGVRYEHRYLIDLSEYRNRTQLGEPSLYRLSKSVEKMQKDVRKMARGVRDLKKIKEEGNSDLD